ncbi:Ger(x)C family spore germination protein [Alicyclobacillus sp. SO9]|uniref:Ger(x)C family spore germination protein n=1 Tax=Alicyclobacillus sp. SO9 TaxID=2665646 RepID=UPI0018E7E4ED|nr:Ger(x)C family spore germination protein [Alicyclobacillus sp. SO9]QQE79953.1 Ger(x)C family spore germination protein [Alicyclobacillus sp. SO9]
MFLSRLVRRSNRWVAVLAVLLTTPFVSGCWDRVELEQRAIILGLAVDEAQSADSNNETSMAHDSKATLSDPKLYNQLQEKQKISVTAQVAVPGRIPLGPGGGDGGGGGGSNPATSVWVVKATGTSLGDAMQELQQHLGERIFLGHLRIITISEEVAKDIGTKPYLDYLRRNPQIRRTAWLTVSKGKAATLMKTAPPLERVPTLYLLSTMQSAIRLGKLPHDFLGSFESKETMWGREPILPYLEVTGKQVKVAGIAAFCDGKMKYTLNPSEVTSYEQLDGSRSTHTTIMVPMGSKGDYVVWTSFARAHRIKVKMVKGKPVVTVYVHVDGNVEEKSRNRVDLQNHVFRTRLENEMANWSEIHMKKIIDKTKVYHTDIFGFGEYVRAYEPGYWRQHVHHKTDWRKLYADLNINVVATFQTHRSGMKV